MRKFLFLFNNIQHSGLHSAIEAMKAKITTEITGAVSYTTVANHISTAVSQLPDYLSKNRNISSIRSDQYNGDISSIYNNYGSINTGHLNNWTKLSDDDRKKINDERA